MNKILISGFKKDAQQNLVMGTPGVRGQQVVKGKPPAITAGADPKVISQITQEMPGLIQKLSLRNSAPIMDVLNDYPQLLISNKVIMDALEKDPNFALYISNHPTFIQMVMTDPAAAQQISQRMSEAGMSMSEEV